MGPCFIVDPIDGTTNFVHGHLYISISLCFAIDRIPQIGIVYNPYTQHLYHGIKGCGSFLTAPSLPTSSPPIPESSSSSSSADQTPTNTTPVISAYTTTQLPLRSPAPPLEGLSTALVAVEWGNERSGSNYATKTRAFAALAGASDYNDSSTKGTSETRETTTTPRKGKMVHSFRSLGSAALNCCGVARGDLDAYWEGGCWAWDVGAGWVIAEEAGAIVVGANPGEWEIAVDARRYLVVRGGEQHEGKVRGAEDGGKRGSEQQKSFIEDFWTAMGDDRLVY